MTMVVGYEDQSLESLYRRLRNPIYQEKDWSERIECAREAMNKLWQAETSDLPVWEVTGKHVPHYLIGVAHWANKNVFSPGTKARQAMMAKVAINISESKHTNDPNHSRNKDAKRKGYVWTGRELTKYCQQQSEEFFALDPDPYSEELKQARDKYTEREVSVTLALQLCAVHFRDLKTLIDLRENGFPKWVQQELFDKREDYWIQQRGLIDKLLNGKKVCRVSVGAAHLVGKSGLLARFKKAGLKLKMLNPQKNYVWEPVKHIDWFRPGCCWKRGGIKSLAKKP